MRAFIVLSLIAVACAQYNYQPTITSGTGTVVSVSGGGGGLIAPSVQVPTAVAPEIEKEFITYTVNDNEFNEGVDAQQAANNLKKSVRVIFIKGPENKGIEDAALALAKQAAQQETAIYVLNKQADLSSLANKLNTINSGNNNKPQVHFVKYRTAEDALNAQRAIQDQYNGLGGNTRTINGGVAPVLNFASQVSVVTSGSNNYGTATSNSYIPPAVSKPSTSYIPPAPVAPATPEKTYIPPTPATTPPKTYVPPAPTTTYIPPATSEPSNTYIPPPIPVDEPSTNYLPASLLSLFRH
ncbi:serine/threonine-protein kinase phg2-like [Musca vetustissima]|uniref:serine/threonine-protein kinase phg2-like n=1 Tax=Musca vetustissima TaxID=27455 RepID=UPI002AB62EF4|nr:serine/threonine-protein kinase phg2-like [Musca vetustissima]